MPTHGNPFQRGYRKLIVRRTAKIIYGATRSRIYLPLHPSQAHLSDLTIEGSACVFGENFALVASTEALNDELKQQCWHHGIVDEVVHQICGGDDSHVVHLGDAYSEERAHEAIKRLSFETGHYSRCWEISSCHLPQDVMTYLEDLADTDTPCGMLFETFRVPGSYGVGCKLFCTPWWSPHLEIVEGRSAEQLREAHRVAHVPETLIDLLHLAAQADTRILILDPDAPVLEGLPTFDD